MGFNATGSLGDVPESSGAGYGATLLRLWRQKETRPPSQPGSWPGQPASSASYPPQHWNLQRHGISIERIRRDRVLTKR